jgi:hypothetical protein
MVKKLAGVLVTAGIALAGMAAPAGAQLAPDPPIICPQGFVPFLPLIVVAPEGTDKNGNFIVCVKEANGQLVWHDDFLDEG